MTLNFIAEQEFFLLDQAGNRQRVRMRISIPEKRKDEHGREVWDCAPRLDGLIDIKKSVMGLSSFGAIVLAVASLRQLLKEFGKGKKIFLADPFNPGEMDPNGEVTLKELFELH